jgi:hypothetical protein
MRSTQADEATRHTEASLMLEIEIAEMQQTIKQIEKVND